MAVAKSLKSIPARSKFFHEALSAFRQGFFVSSEEFWTSVESWRKQTIRSYVQLGVEFLALANGCVVTLFMNAQGCLVAALSSGVVLYSVTKL